MRFNPRAFQTAQARQPAPEPGAGVHLAPQAPSPEPGSAWLTAYGRPGANRVTVPLHQTAVTLCLKYNGSNPQVDHFDYHARLGCPDYLILLVRKQPQTEALARRALSLCPGLQRLDWTWHTERYAGGHGNYLQSSPFPYPAGLPTPYCQVSLVFWEIEFTASHPGHTLELWPHQHFGDKSIIPNSQTLDPTPQTPITAAMILNPQFNGVEIHFTRRPSDTALAPLRADRAWRYTGRTQCWYARQTPATLAFARTYVEAFNQPKPDGDRFIPQIPQIPQILPPTVSPTPPPVPLSAPTVPPRKIIHFVS